MTEFGTDVLVPMAAVFFIFGLPVLAFVLFRTMAHRERMAMIRHGLPPGPVPHNVMGTSVPRPMPVSDYSLEQAQCTLRKGIRLTFVGFALTLGLSLIGYHGGPAGSWIEPGPWLLGGLVPMFVGIAQLIIALISGATFGPQRSAYAQAPPPQFAAPGYSPPPAGPAPSYDNPYTYRPGATQELQAPPLPPERR